MSPLILLQYTANYSCGKPQGIIPYRLRRITTEQAADKTLITRAAASFFSDLGFKTNEQGSPGAPGVGNYTLRANVRFETITQSVISCRYYLDAALVNRNGTAAFTFTTDDRKAYPDTASEARRLAVRTVETSFKEGQFANEFNSWLLQMSKLTMRTTQNILTAMIFREC
jgi:hypothetical protein